MRTPTSIVYNEDCIQGMKRYPDKYFDLAVVDPPYGINIETSGDKCSDYKPAIWDNESPQIEYFTELFRVSKKQIIWGANHFISKMPFDSSCWILWDKKFSSDVSFAQFELAWTSFSGTCKKFDRFPNSSETRIHPTQKPVALYDWIYKNYLPNGGKVLDTHLGSGSNRIAAHKAGNIYFTGYELDKDYYDAEQKRFAAYLSQPALQFPNLKETEIKNNLPTLFDLVNEKAA